MNADVQAVIVTLVAAAAFVGLIWSYVRKPARPRSTQSSAPCAKCAASAAEPSAGGAPRGPAGVPPHAHH